MQLRDGDSAQREGRNYLLSLAQVAPRGGRSPVSGTMAGQQRRGMSAKPDVTSMATLVTETRLRHWFSVARDVFLLPHSLVKFWPGTTSPVSVRHCSGLDQGIVPATHSNR